MSPRLRSRQVHLYLLVDEYEELAAAAKRSSTSLSGFVRLCALKEARKIDAMRDPAGHSFVVDCNDDEYEGVRVSARIDKQPILEWVRQALRIQAGCAIDSEDAVSSEERALAKRLLGEGW